MAQTLKSIGVDLEVFSGSRESNSSQMEDGVLVHRTNSSDPRKFRHLVAKTFSRMHKLDPYDLVEGPEYNADILEIQKSNELATILKLHTPRKLIFDNEHLLYGKRAKILESFYQAAKLRYPVWGYRGVSRSYVKEILQQDRIEKESALSAKIVTSPSSALSEYILSLIHISEPTRPY